jgi:hypothetical protein
MRRMGAKPKRRDRGQRSEQPATCDRVALALEHVEHARSVLYAGPGDQWDPVASALLTALDEARRETLDRLSRARSRK